jgi:hypothetical protein
MFCISNCYTSQNKNASEVYIFLNKTVCVHSVSNMEPLNQNANGKIKEMPVSIVLLALSTQLK